MSENNEQKRLIFVGFYQQDLVDLIDHLVTTGYNEEQTKHLQDVLLAKVSG